MKLVSVNEASKILGLHIMTIYILVKKGDLKAVRVGRRVLISEVELNQFIEKCSSIAADKTTK